MVCHFRMSLTATFSVYVLSLWHISKDKRTINLVLIPVSVRGHVCQTAKKPLAEYNH